MVRLGSPLMEELCELRRFAESIRRCAVGRADHAEV